MKNKINKQNGKIGKGSYQNLYSPLQSRKNKEKNKNIGGG